MGPLYFIDILYSSPKGERPLITSVKGTLAVMVVLEIEMLLNNELGSCFEIVTKCVLKVAKYKD